VYAPARVRPEVADVPLLLRYDMPINALRSVSDHFDEILRHVNPKRLVAEMVKSDKAFFFKYFKGYKPEQIGRGRIKQIAQKEVFADPGHELFANLIIIHWNEAHANMYRDIVLHVRAINEDVEAIERIEPDKAHAIIDDMLKKHPRQAFLLCVKLNGVRFDDDIIESRLAKGEAAPVAAAS
jgi:hypothetical protein